ncbi:MAG: four helix bundle protein [Bdellovibrio sp.]|nr:four helix bundle protein [Bdellovibrio sp.]
MKLKKRKNERKKERKVKNMKMLKGFIAYEMAVQLFKECEEVKTNRVLKDQLTRASSSIVLNISEGSTKPSLKDKRRFYSIALGSLRETQSILNLANQDELFELAYKLGGLIYRLVYPK